MAQMKRCVKPRSAMMSHRQTTGLARVDNASKSRSSAPKWAIKKDQPALYLMLLCSLHFHPCYLSSYKCSRNFPRNPSQIAILLCHFRQYQCDLQKDCVDGSDEEDCEGALYLTDGKTECDKNKYITCPNSNETSFVGPKCIPKVCKTAWWFCIWCCWLVEVIAMGTWEDVSTESSKFRLCTNTSILILIMLQELVS